MTPNEKLISVKTIHTLIWIFFNLVFFYLFYALLTNTVDYLFWIGVGLIGLECVVLLANQWSCPLTAIARRYSDSEKDNFDIYLPLWLARYNKLIYSMIFLLLALIYLIRFVW